MAQSFDELFRRAISLYDSGNYRDALELMNRESEKFPESSQDTYYVKMCLTAVLGETEETLRLFREAIDSGLWFSVTMLRNDPDFATLQGNPEFEQLVEICNQRKLAAQEKSIPKRILLRPDSKSDSLLLALHGNNGNAERFTDVWKSAVASGWNVLIPQSSQVSGPDRYVWNDRDWAIKEILDHYEQIRNENTVKGDNIVVSGFSMGGGTAIWLALGGLMKTRGFIAVAPSLPDPENLRSLLDEKNTRGIRGYFVVGKKDIRSLELCEQISEMMREKGLECRVERHDDLGHAFPLTFEKSLSEALKFITA